MILNIFFLKFIEIENVSNKCIGTLLYFEYNSFLYSIENYDIRFNINLIYLKYSLQN